MNTWLPYIFVISFFTFFVLMMVAAIYGVGESPVKFIVSLYLVGVSILIYLVYLSSPDRF